ncbi:ATP-binding cassette domain-containing protein [Streptomyces sp. NBC_01373]|uniref:ATP-binding cassette domain-containing protein n=1 Tax=Streptomyces sp. NBC_01373 TaxID=2903843 RepID=UPI00225920C2|nr:ATP-binding cassette domain-containing protein [Streptomyces sp. NBC_01373]MCX4701244.1 ATP-binding cassette domain-containing protein [Streptomyces sp. NBC_01373]
MAEPMISTRDLTKSYDRVHALRGVSLDVAEGTVLGLLGHNGAGKTTLVNILATLLPPSGGSAAVAGHDVLRDSRAVRGCIGLTGQFASVDEKLSGFDNLVLIGRLLGASARQARERADELLDTFDLSGAARRLCRTYSGGMRRRLDLAASLVGRPRVIFLDEPSTGLDPASRLSLWETVEALVADGTTVLLTTQYLEEAERLADTVAVLAEGSVVAAGTPNELKSQVGERRAQLSTTRRGDTVKVAEALRRAGFAAVQTPEEGTVSVPVADFEDFAQVVRAVEEAAVPVTGLTLSEPSLDDVYLSLAAKPTAAAAR